MQIAYPNSFPTHDTNNGCLATVKFLSVDLPTLNLQTNIIMKAKSIVRLYSDKTWQSSITELLKFGIEAKRYKKLKLGFALY